jgi:hypothetical protein
MVTLKATRKKELFVHQQGAGGKEVAESIA